MYMSIEIVLCYKTFIGPYRRDGAIRGSVLS